MISRSKSDLFEKNVLTVACIIGLIRILLAFIENYRHETALFDWLVDIIYAVTFSSGILFIWTRGSIRNLVIFFYLPFVTLQIVAFCREGGLEQSADHNIFAGLVLIALTLRDKLTLYFALFLILGTTGCLIYLEVARGISATFQSIPGSDLGFIYASIAMIGFTFYAKGVFSNKRKTLDQNMLDLKRKSLELTQKSDELIEQREKLERLTIALDKKVASRTKELKSQMKRREKYLSIAMNDLEESYESATSVIKNLDAKNGDQLVVMLKKSASNLEKEVFDLKEKLK